MENGLRFEVLYSVLEYVTTAILHNIRISPTPTIIQTINIGMMTCRGLLCSCGPRCPRLPHQDLRQQMPDQFCDGDEYLEELGCFGSFTHSWWEIVLMYNIIYITVYVCLYIS